MQPIESLTSVPQLPPHDWVKEEKAEELEAGKEVTSLWYATTMQSLREAADIADPKLSEKELAALEGHKEEKSFIGKMQDWLWGNMKSLWGTLTSTVSKVKQWFKGVLGIEKKEKTKEKSKETAVSKNQPPISSLPKLDAPEEAQQLKMKQALLDFNREMARRLKEIQEFEEEMRRCNSNKLDKLIFIHFVSTSLKQKEIHEGATLLSNDELLRNMNKNKALQKTYYSLADEIRNITKTSDILHWVNVGAVTVGMAGTLALTFATGGIGTVLLAALPLASLTGGATKLMEGTMRYNAELKSGERFVISQETKENGSKIRDELKTMQGNEQDISILLKAIRRQLEEQSQAERAGFSR